MQAPHIAYPDALDDIPDAPAVFLLWPRSGQPYLARTSLLRRRLRRLLNRREGFSPIASLSGIIERIEYWRSASQLSSSITHLQLAQTHFPEDWQRITRLRTPVLLRLTLENTFPRTMLSTRFGRGLSFGPFLTRTAAESFETQLLDLFQVRRCEENLEPSPEHPGCIYGEMNRCMRPCQQAVTRGEYHHEAARVEQFLLTRGASLQATAEAARDLASQEMQFEEAARLHQRIEKINQVQAAAGGLARAIDQLAGVAILPSLSPEAVELRFLIGGCWQTPVIVGVSEAFGAGASMDARLRRVIADLKPEGAPNSEHLAILTRWYGSSWRDGEWLEMDWPSKIPYRKLVNAIGRVASEKKTGSEENARL